MTPYELDTTKLAAAKLWLTTGAASARGGKVGDAPYLAAAVYALVTVSTDEVASTAADEFWRLYINPSWLAYVDVPDVAARLAHLIYHLLLDHAGRARSMQVGPRQRRDWAEAADLAIAECLEGAHLPLDGLVLPAQRHLAPGRSTEERFAVSSRLPAFLPKDDRPDGDTVDANGDNTEKADGCGSACDGLSRTFELPATEQTPRVGTVQGEQIRQAVAIAYKGHRSERGTEPGEFSRFVERILEPTVPWEQVLGAAVRRAVAWGSGLTDYTYSRRSRRQAAVPSVILPGMRRPVPDVALVVDTSGSVDDGLLARALGEVDGALRSLGPAGSSVRVLATDAAVHDVQRVRRARDVKLTGGGGTDMQEGLRGATALRPRCDVCIVLTDGDSPWPKQPPPGMSVIIALLGRDRAALPATPPWAERVECVPGRPA